VKGIENYVLTVLLGVIVMVIAIIVLWLVLSGYLKFGVNIASAISKAVTCNICNGLPESLSSLKGIFCGGC
jgi:hypothetical protein